MTVLLSPVGGAGVQFFDNNGDPLSGGKLYTYDAGTTTPRASYTTLAGNVAHTNPIVLDSAGRIPSGGEVWLTDAVPYKFVLQTSTDVLIATWDNITGINGSGIATDAINVAYTPPGTGAVSTTVAAKLNEWISVKNFGAVGNASTNDAAAINKAITYAITIGGGLVYFPAGKYRCTTRIGTFLNASNVTLFGYGAEIQNYAGSNVQGLMQFGNATLDVYGMYSASNITVRNLNIVGIKFTSSNTIVPATGRWTDQMPVSVNTAENVLIKDCYFENWDFAAIDFGAICKNALIDSCTFYSSATDAGHANYGVRAFCYANYTNYSNGNGDLSPTDPNTGVLKAGYVYHDYNDPLWGHEAISVSNCYFENVSHGVMVSSARRGVISNNVFKNCSTRSISLTTYSVDYLCSDNLHSLDTVQQTSTGVSVFYGLGQATFRHTIQNEKFGVMGTVNAPGFSPIKCYFNSHQWVVRDCDFQIPSWTASGASCVNVEANSDGEVRDNHFYCPNIAHPVSFLPTAGIASPNYQQQKIWVVGNIFEAFSTGAIQVWDTTTAPEPIVIKDNIVNPSATRFVAAKVDVSGRSPKLFLQGNQILGDVVRYIDNTSTYKAILLNVDVLEFKTRLSTGGGVANPSSTAVSFDYSSYFLPSCFSSGTRSYDFTTYGGRENSQASTDFYFAITGETATSVSGNIVRNAGSSFQQGYTALTVRFFGLVT